MTAKRLRELTQEVERQRAVVRDGGENDDILIRLHRNHALVYERRGSTLMLNDSELLQLRDVLNEWFPRETMQQENDHVEDDHGE